MSFAYCQQLFKWRIFNFVFVAKVALNTYFFYFSKRQICGQILFIIQNNQNLLLSNICLFPDHKFWLKRNNFLILESGKYWFNYVNKIFGNCSLKIQRYIGIGVVMITIIGLPYNYDMIFIKSRRLFFLRANINDSLSVTQTCLMCSMNSHRVSKVRCFSCKEKNIIDGLLINCASPSHI